MTRVIKNIYKQFLSVFTFVALFTSISSLFFVKAATFLDQNLGALAGQIYNIGYPLAITLGVFFIVWEGYRIIMSEGEPNKLDDAKEGLTAAIVGTLFVILAIVILRIIIGSFLRSSL